MHKITCYFISAITQGRKLKKSVKFSLKKCCIPHGDAKVFLLSVCCLLILVDSAIRLWRKEEKKNPSDMLGSY